MSYWIYRETLNITRGPIICSLDSNTVILTGLVVRPKSDCLIFLHSDFYLFRNNTVLQHKSHV